MDKKQRLTGTPRKIFQRIANFFFFLTIFFLPSYLVRLSVFGVPVNVLDILEFLTILFCLISILFRKENISFRKVFSDRRITIVGFLVIFFGTLLSAYFSEGFQSWEFGIVKSWVFLPFLFVLMGSICGFSLKKAVQTYIWSSVVSSLVAFLLPNEFSITYDNRLRGWYDSPNQLALFIIPAGAVAWFWFLGAKEYFSRIAFALAFFLLTYTLWRTQSLGASIALLGGIAFGEAYLFLRSKIKQKYIFFLFFLGIFLLLGTIFFWRNEKILSERSSLASRMMIWRSAWRIVENNPVWGIGPGNFQKKYLECQKAYPPYLEWAAPHPHNTFLEFWLYSGILGFFGFLGLVFLVFWIFFIEEKKKTPDHFVVGSFFGFFSMLAFGSVDGVFWGNALSVIFWILYMEISRRRR